MAAHSDMLKFAMSFAVAELKGTCKTVASAD